MPRLTEIVYYRKPIMKYTNYKFVPRDVFKRPRTLHDFVSGKKEAGKRTVCTEQLSVMLECFKKNDYEDKYCTQEITKFYSCINNYKEKLQQRKEAELKGLILRKGERMSAKRVNELIRKYPHPTK